MTKTKIKKTRADLNREIRELKAQLAHTSHFAMHEINRMSMDHVMGSAVIVEITTLGGRVTAGPFAIRDGLSPETIKALAADLQRTYDGAIAFKPGVVK